MNKFLKRIWLYLVFLLILPGLPASLLIAHILDTHDIGCPSDSMAALLYVFWGLVGWTLLALLLVL